MPSTRQRTLDGGGTPSAMIRSVAIFYASIVGEACSIRRPLDPFKVGSDDSEEESMNPPPYSVCTATSLVLPLLLTALVQPSGQATIAGVVLADGSPIPGAVVTLTGSSVPYGLSTVTDLAGRFSFSDLATGRLTAVATKPGFVRQAWQAGTSVVLEDGKSISNIRLVLTKGASVSGTIRNQRGQPVSGLLVSLLRGADDLPFEGVSAPTPEMYTGSGGSYRFFGLVPGRYFLVAAQRGAGAGQVEVLSTVDVDSALADLRRRSLPRGGSFPTSAGPVLPGRPSIAPVDALEQVPTFFPGTAIGSEAVALVLSTGQELSNIDFQLAAARAVWVAGSIDAAHLPVSSVRIGLYASGPTPPFAAAGPGSRLSVAPTTERNFRYDWVPPGQYTLVATGSTHQVAGGRRDDAYWATRQIVVRGEPLADLRLVLQPAASLSGRIEFETKAAAQIPDRSNISIVLLSDSVLGLPASPSSAVGSSKFEARITQGGRFETVGLMPGKYRIVGSVASVEGWWLRSAMVNGGDVLDSGLELEAGAVLQDAVLKFTRLHSRLDVSMTATASTQPDDYVVLVFGADRASWYAGSRRIAAVRPSASGVLSIGDLPGGDYFIAAQTDFYATEARLADMLDRVSRTAMKIRISDGQRTQVHLKID